MLLTIIYLVGIFTLLVAAHEFGHMWVAKRFKMKVEEFAIGIGPILGYGVDATARCIRFEPSQSVALLRFRACCPTKRI